MNVSPLKKTLSLTLLLLLAACSSLVHEPKVTLKKANLIGMDTAGVDIEFYLSVTNPNPFDLTLQSYTYDLRVMTLPLASGGHHESLSFKPKAETDVRLPVRVKYSDMLEVLKRRPDPDRIPYTMDARLRISTFAGEMTIPVERSDTFPVPEKFRPSRYLDRLKDFLK